MTLFRKQKTDEGENADEEVDETPRDARGLLGLGGNQGATMLGEYADGTKYIIHKPDMNCPYCSRAFPSVVPGSLGNHVRIDHPEKLKEWLRSREG
jgi:hypothetical protein